MLVYWRAAGGQLILYWFGGAIQGQNSGFKLQNRPWTRSRAPYCSLFAYKSVSCIYLIVHCKSSDRIRVSASAFLSSLVVNGLIFVIFFAGFLVVRNPSMYVKLTCDPSWERGTSKSMNPEPSLILSRRGIRSILILFWVVGKGQKDWGVERSPGSYP